MLKIICLLIYCNLAAVIFLAGKEVFSAWSREVGLAFGLGFIAGCVLYQIAHRLRYGHWFDPPSNPPE